MAQTPISNTEIDPASPVSTALMTALRDHSAIDIQTFTSSGTWSKPVEASTVEVFVWGAGGGGAADGRSGLTIIGANGGAGGGFAKYTFLADDLASSLSVTVGAGGAGSVAPAGSSGGGATSGGASSFHTVSAGGGGLGTMTGGTTAPAGGGAVGLPTETGGEAKRIENDGSTSNSPNTTVSGAGGGNVRGEGGHVAYSGGDSIIGGGDGGDGSLTVGVNGGDGVVPGGGGGGHYPKTGAAANGGDGADGLVVVVTY